MITTSEDGSRIEERLAARFEVNASWVIKLRWVASAGQFLTILGVVWGLAIEVPTVPLGGALLVTIASNGVLTFWFARRRRAAARRPTWRATNRILGGIMGLDLLSLTAMLYLTGGPNNPFSFFFFVNLSLCAVVLTGSWAWSLTLISILCFGGLLVDFRPLLPAPDLDPVESIRQAGRLSVVHCGLLIAFATCASVIVYFMTRLNHELRLNEQILWQAEEREARSDKLQALGTLAAGAAHELASPLSTIAVVAREVENEIRMLTDRAELIDEIELIRDELDRCRLILDRMSAEAGQVTGEALSDVSVGELLRTITYGLPADFQVNTRISPDTESLRVSAPVNGLAQAIRGIVHNAHEASPPGQPVELYLENRPDRLILKVCDRGHGMTKEVIKRVNEPFFTTKEPGQGMGLGVFLAQTLIDQLSGSLSFQSKPGVGTTVTVELPLTHAHPPEAPAA